MTRANLSARDRALLEVRELLRSLAAAMSLDLEEQLAALEQRLIARIDARRTVRVRIVRQPNDARLVARAVPPKSPAGPAPGLDSGGPFRHAPGAVHEHFPLGRPR